MFKLMAIRLISSIFIIISTYGAMAQEVINYDLELDLESRFEYLTGLEGDENEKVRDNTARLKNFLGLWNKPKKKISKLIQQYRHFIIEVADIYEVPPEAIAGVILAEHTLNYGVEDHLQNYLAKEIGIEEADKIFMKATGRGASFGFAQVTVNNEGFSDKVMGRVEPGLVFNYREQLLTFKGSIRIIAATLRGEQDAYLREGFDISESPGILATIFNLGQGFLRAKAAADEGRNPQHNYLGMFVVQNIDIIEDLLFLED